MDEYGCKPNEVKLIAALYNVDRGKFLGPQKRLAFVMVRGDLDEAYFSYGFNKAKSKKLYSTSKKLFQTSQRTANETRGIHHFFCLPSTTDRSHNINQFRENVSLTPLTAHMKILDNIQKQRKILSQQIQNRKISKTNKSS